MTRITLKMAPFKFDALRPFVSVTLHKIAAAEGKSPQDIPAISSEEVASELSEGLTSLFDLFEIEGSNPYKISANQTHRGVIETKTEQDLTLTGVWFKRTTAPSWLDADLGPEEVRDTINHILFFVICYPYVAVLGTHDKTRELVSEDLTQGACGKKQLSFIAPPINQEALERAFVRGQTRVSWLSGLHARVPTKPDSKTLQGRDLRHAIDPFSDQTFTFTSAVSILPELQQRRKITFQFADPKMAKRYEHYAFRVGVTPEQHRVWTVPTKEFKHLVEELRVLFDTLDLPPNRALIFDWGHNQDGLKFLAKPIAGDALADVKSAFDVGLDLPPPPDPGSDVVISSDREQCREKWRAYGEMEIVNADENSAKFAAAVRFDGQTLLEFDVAPRALAEGTIELQMPSYRPLKPYHDGLTCFETLLNEGRVNQDRAVTMTVRYDSNHVIRGSRLFLLRWQDVLFDSWKWCFTPERSNHKYSAALEKPPRTSKGDDPPTRERGQGWEGNLGEIIGNPGSLFEYVVANAQSLFKPEPNKDWHLCCDDGPGEVADFVYFEPDAGRLYLIHIKGAHIRGAQTDKSKRDKGAHGGAQTDKSKRDISVKAYEEVVSQATKNLRYLDAENLLQLLEKGVALPIGEACFYNGTRSNREKILEALNRHKKTRLQDKRVIVFQPHVRKSLWEEAQDKWQHDVKATPQNQINRFLQLRTLLADAEITCRKIGALFEAWGEDDADDAIRAKPTDKDP